MNKTDSGVTFRRSVPGDEPELKRLWQAVFGDTPEFIDTFFEILYAPGTACLALKDGGMVSAGYCLPGALARGKKCSYIYAVATYPEYRRSGAAAGVVRCLAEQAFADGADIVVTLPASESLTGWYEKVLGMKPAFMRGGPGAEFPASWHRFAAYCGQAETDSPKRLWAVGAPGIDTDDYRDTGWAFTFE
jgi:ribosomal protein S18 acetylase RimI-like enzyme